MLEKGDKVKWKFRYGETHGIITKIHTSDFIFMNRQRRASHDSPQYEVISEKTGKSAVHKASALKKI
ncbi:HVA1 family protein [Flavobacteriaceae bacterium W22]|nr:HVA1 family protein [Flavobacteriaceae bacterium W22]